jgi:hypothetical protein
MSPVHLLYAPLRAASDADIVAAMITCDELEIYGYRRVGADQRERGIVVNFNKIGLMREHGLPAQAPPNICHCYGQTRKLHSALDPICDPRPTPTIPRRKAIGGATTLEAYR